MIKNENEETVKIIKEQKYKVLDILLSSLSAVQTAFEIYPVTDEEEDMVITYSMSMIDDIGKTFSGKFVELEKEISEDQKIGIPTAEA